MKRILTANEALQLLKKDKQLRFAEDCIHCNKCFLWRETGKGRIGSYGQKNYTGCNHEGEMQVIGITNEQLKELNKF